MLTTKAVISLNTDRLYADSLSEALQQKAGLRAWDANQLSDLRHNAIELIGSLIFQRYK